MEFDLDLAKEQSEKNPVYYIQYAYARIHSILAKIKIKNKILKLNLLKLGLNEFEKYPHEQNPVYCWVMRRISSCWTPAYEYY
jgi:hypothetical protein